MTFSAGMPARRSVVFFLMPSLRSRLVELFLPLTGIKHAFGSEAAMRRAIARNRLAGPALPSQGMRRRLLIEETGLPVLVADDPLTCVVRGCGLALERMDKLGTIFASE